MTTVMTYASLQNDILTYLDRNDSKLVAMVPEFITLGELRCAREVNNLGLKTCVASNMSANTYIYQKPHNWLETININFGNADQFNTVSRSSSFGIVTTSTLTFSKPHNFMNLKSITVFNVGNSLYNGQFSVLGHTQYSVSYINPNGSFVESTTADTGGIATQPLANRTQLLPRSLEYCNNFWPDRTQVGVPRFYADYDYNNFLIVPTPQIGYPFEIVMQVQPEFLSDTNTTNWWTQFARDLLLFACLLESAPYLKNDARIGTWQDRYDRSAKAITNQTTDRINDASIMRKE